VLADPTAPRTPAIDVYAYGVLLLEIMSGRRAFPKGTFTAFIRNTVLSGGRPPLPDARVLHPALAELIAACWAQVWCTRAQVRVGVRVTVWCAMHGEALPLARTCSTIDEADVGVKGCCSM
jgi:hypothetical protein